jgi:hypothetical protein
VNAKDLAIVSLVSLVVILSWRLVTLSRTPPCPESPKQDEQTSYWLNRSADVKSKISSERLSKKD